MYLEKKLWHIDLESTNKSISCIIAVKNNSKPTFVAAEH